MIYCFRTCTNVTIKSFNACNRSRFLNVLWEGDKKGFEFGGIWVWNSGGGEFLIG